jgi:hypothetical protein
MIYFTIPAGTYGGRVVSQTQVDLDRGVNSSSSTIVHEGTGLGPLTEVKANGINNVEEEISFSIKVLEDDKYLDIVKYFESLRGKAINLVFPDETKKIILLSWSASLVESPYTSLGVKARLVYL